MNRSLSPSSGVMNPKPFASLNHFTVPVAIKNTSLAKLTNGQGRRLSATELVLTHEQFSGVPPRSPKPSRSDHPAPVGASPVRLDRAGVLDRLSGRLVASCRRCLFPFLFQHASFLDESLALELGPRRLSLALRHRTPRLSRVSPAQAGTNMPDQRNDSTLWTSMPR